MRWLLCPPSCGTHGPYGDFDVPLPFEGAPGGESWSGGINSTRKIVVTFNPVTAGNAPASAGSVSGTPTFAGNLMIVNLTGVLNAQQITVMLTDATHAFGQLLPSAAVSMNVLVGDGTRNRLVNSSDVSHIKALSGDPVDASKFRCEFNADGSVSASDISQVEAASGTFIP